MPRLSALQKYMVWYGLDNFEKKCSFVISSELPLLIYSYDPVNENIEGTIVLMQFNCWQLSSVIQYV